jgi:hypothetical protein
MLVTMKSITRTISGLASSLFLNVGLARVAEQLDPTMKDQRRTDYAGPVFSTNYPCCFTPRPAR